MRLPLLLVLFAMPGLALAQTSYPPASRPPAQPNAATPANPADLGMLLQRIEQETQGLDADVGKLRVDKWKTDSATKYQAAENVGSIQRNITAALPALITAARTAPQSLAANFKLYRNLNALYDVVSALGELVGAFGKREEYDTVAPHAAALDGYRRSYADYLQQITTIADNRLAAAERVTAEAAAAPAAPQKKIIVDDGEPTPVPPRKKRIKKSTANGSSAGTSAPK